MSDLTHLGVGGGFFKINAAAFFHGVQPGVFVNRQDSAGGFVHHDVVRSAVIADDSGRAGGHGFYDHIPEGIRGAWEQEEIRIGVKTGESFAALFASKVYAAVAFEELLDFFEVPAVTHIHEFLKPF